MFGKLAWKGFFEKIFKDIVQNIFVTDIENLLNYDSLVKKVWMFNLEFQSQIDSTLHAWINACSVSLAGTTSDASELPGLRIRKAKSKS